MYLVGSLPKHVVAFQYGKRLTKKRKNKIAKKLLEFTAENYDIPDRHRTMERSIATVENEFLFDRYKEFRKTYDGYETESGSIWVGRKPVLEFDIT